VLASFTAFAGDTNLNAIDQSFGAAPVVQPAREPQVGRSSSEPTSAILRLLLNNTKEGECRTFTLFY